MELQEIHIEALEPFVERETELPKETLLHRIEGKVSNAFALMLSMIQFYRIGKDDQGKMYLV